ncbi:MAG TPA: hypothetical protein VHB77_10530, partial [Planctomycetaceae bacterium]|nr:hypothetical protein [Planctomycetaceae bacterium]
STGVASTVGFVVPFWLHEGGTCGFFQVDGETMLYGGICMGAVAVGLAILGYRNARMSSLLSVASGICFGIALLPVLLLVYRDIMYSVFAIKTEP